jgi:hypothetical protein
VLLFPGDELSPLDMLNCFGFFLIPLEPRSDRNEFQDGLALSLQSCFRGGPTSSSVLSDFKTLLEKENMECLFLSVFLGEAYFEDVWMSWLGRLWSARVERLSAANISSISLFRTLDVWLASSQSI